MTMQDRFKFRAWDSIQEFYEWDIEYCYDGFICCNFGDFLDKSRYIVEQCTGLKDNNGKLIYEGDIVRQISKREPEYEEYITVVEWCGFGYPLYDKEEFDYVIIGNIHENPDLLENKDE